MFGISIPELLLVFVIVLVIFGPERLPEMAAKLGRLSAKLKKTSDSVRREVYNHVYEPAKDFSNKLDPGQTLTTIEADLTEYLKPKEAVEIDAKKEDKEEK